MILKDVILGESVNNTCLTSAFYPEKQLSISGGNMDATIAAISTAMSA